LSLGSSDESQNKDEELKKEEKRITRLASYEAIDRSRSKDLKLKQNVKHSLTCRLH